MTDEQKHKCEVCRSINGAKVTNDYCKNVCPNGREIERGDITMANNCWYDMKVVSKNKSSLERLLKIMNYEDEEYYLYRIFSVEGTDIEYDEENKLYSFFLAGDIAWSCSPLVYDYNKKYEGENKTYCSITYLCKILDFGVEIFAEEDGCCFQQHLKINHQGDVIESETEEWHDTEWDDDGNVIPEHGGFDNFCDFCKNTEIY